MGSIRSVPRCQCCFVVGLLHPASAAAQAVGTATIAGTVTDASGAVLPGVTVEATQSRTHRRQPFGRPPTTRVAIRSSTCDLAPYTVTFTLAGFSTVKREGIELTSDFTANVNSQPPRSALSRRPSTVQSGRLSSTCRASGRPKVYTRDVVDALPTDRTPNARPVHDSGHRGGEFRSVLVPGLGRLADHGRRDAHDVPGRRRSREHERADQQQHVSRSSASRTTSIPPNSVSLGCASIWCSRDGGNQFHAHGVRRATRGTRGSRTISTTRCAPRVSRLPAQTPKQWDFNPSGGGPIRRDSLWYYFTYQNIGQDTVQTGSFYDADPLPYRYVADPNRPGISQVRSSQHRTAVDVAGHPPRQDRRILRAIPLRDPDLLQRPEPPGAHIHRCASVAGNDAGCHDERRFRRRALDENAELTPALRYDHQWFGPQQLQRLSRRCRDHGRRRYLADGIPAVGAGDIRHR